MTASALDSPRKRVPLFAEASSGLAISRSPSPTLQFQQPVRSEEQKGRRPQDQATSRAKRVSGSFPGNPLSRITVCCRLCRSHPAESGTSRFAEPTLCYFPVGRNTKNGPLCEEPVDVATSLWKFEEI